MKQAARNADDKPTTLMPPPCGSRACAVNGRVCLIALGLALGLLTAIDVGRKPENVPTSAATRSVGQDVAAASERVQAATNHSTEVGVGDRARPNELPAGRYVAAVRLTLANPETPAADLLSALLTVPAGWQTGDAAAVVVAEQPWVEGWRTRLMDELLAEGTAVLDLDVHTRRGAAANNTVSPPSLTPHDLPPDLFGALRFLAGAEIRAGTVLALGRGAGGEAALLAVQQRAGTQYLGLHGPRFAAGACLDAGCEWSVSTSETPEGWRAGALSAGTALAAGGPLASDQL